MPPPPFPAIVHADRRAASSYGPRARVRWTLADYSAAPPEAQRRTVTDYRRGGRDRFHPDLRRHLERVVAAEDAVRADLSFPADLFARVHTPAL